MSTQRFSPEMSVSEALGAARGITAVFIMRRTACPGCYLARFCTLRDVALAYGLSLDALLEELQEAARAELTHITGAQNDQ